MSVCILKGQASLSAFRKTALIDRLRQALPDLGIEVLDAWQVYFVEPAAGSALSPETLERACSLLTAEGGFGGQGGFFVTPRKGTISPWSSKATDIFRNCGLTEVRRVERGVYYRICRANGAALPLESLRPVLQMLHDRMTEGVYVDVSDLFRHVEPAPFKTVDVLAGGRAALERANRDWGLALSGEEIDYLYGTYSAIRRNPTDVELVMFGQVNSEHCRHKIFNAEWIIDGQKKDRSLFAMIRNTHACHPEGTLVAYADNSAVAEGFPAEWFEAAEDGTHRYVHTPGQIDLIMKVETHNHPTAISPFAGAATGVGGEIRDEGATGIGGRSKAGLSAFMVSNLKIPGYRLPWEKDFADFPGRLATPFEIMTDGPLGGARFGNEFGRPQLCGLFRTFETLHNGRYRGYHKPIMAAGGMGNIKREHVRKHEIRPGSLILQLGGPALRIGLGGGAASSMATGSNSAELDFDSVQRDNAEMQRRCQCVLDACLALGSRNPILSVHDIGAGGLSNGCPELVSETGGRFHLRKVPNEDRSMSPMEIWCCEAQERYVLAVAPKDLDRFLALCGRERCPVAVLGEATGDGHLTLIDEHFGNKPIDIDLGVILGKPPKMLRDVRRKRETHAPLDWNGIELREAAERVLRLPCVANKTFLITIADRSITGLVARDQMTGPYQTPVSDVAVTATTLRSFTGEAMAMGERTVLAVLSPEAAGRMAVGEALTNIAAADVGRIGNVKLSANWMCACGEEGEDAGLFDTVRAVGMELCPQLGISIPVGKDSMSMRTVWQSADGTQQKMTAPLSLLVSAFAPVDDVRRTVTPEFKAGAPSRLILIDLGAGRNRMGGSALAQVYGQMGAECPDLDNPKRMAGFFVAIQEMVRRGLLLAYHDRSDGGVWVSLCEMAFAARVGVRVQLDALGADIRAALFSEELGAVLQVSESHLVEVRRILAEHGLDGVCHDVGAPCFEGEGRGWIEIEVQGRPVLREKVAVLQRAWTELTYRMQASRDNPECAGMEYDNLLDETDPGMSLALTFDPALDPLVVAPSVCTRRPRMAILREQGINGHIEMAGAFDRAGFEAVDVHMTDLLGGRVDLEDFAGLVACGGFSYGDVLGAGSGWAKSVLFNEPLKDMFRRFFARQDTLALGVCNGCQMISQLKEIIPGAEAWPEFTRNKSEQFEARYVTVEILPSDSIFFAGMEGSRLGIPVAHGEGFADFRRTGSPAAVQAQRLVCVRFVDSRGQATERYPFNPNGSPGGLTGLTAAGGRVTILMPHPERAFRSVQLSWRPAGMFEGEEGPWLRMFRNARKFAG